MRTFDAITFMDEDQYDDEIKERNPFEMFPYDEIRLFPQKIIESTSGKEMAYYYHILK